LDKKIPLEGGKLAKKVVTTSKVVTTLNITSPSTSSVQH